MLEETPRTEVRATAKYVRTAPRKAQLVAEQIRGRSVPEARTILTFMTRDAARDVGRVFASAVANAETNHGLDGDDLYVATATVGAGPTLKRWRARARGRVGRIKKRTCHITIRVAPIEGVAVLSAPARKAAATEAAPRRVRRAGAGAPVAPEAAVVEAPAEEAGSSEEAAPAEERPKRAPRKKAAESEPKEEES